MAIIYGIDVGSEKSGICIWDTQKQKILCADDQYPNHMVAQQSAHYYVIEDIKSYGMPVGKTTFDTCKAIGRFQERMEKKQKSYALIFKSDIQLHFCHTTKAKDANVKRVLLDRFGEKGTKKNQGITYGLKNHSWDAFALCVYLEDHIKDDGSLKVELH
ncbi:MAG: hypothetical protein CMH64_02990 [Nanoarchaeota archaeon]|jgi:hypothetical protein|nr:hypothetical protein [Nanoarchaeota archaeon]|tara:strand:- start:5612 stop:6088 length:477 start_codon:yes stop_codon:yes gene_type:complete